MKTSHITFLLFSVLTVLAAQPQVKTLNLRYCIDFAIENNLNLKNQELNQIVLQNNYKQSKYDLLPDINASSRLSRNFGQNYNYDQSKFIDEQVTSFSIGASSDINLFEGFRKMHLTNKKKLEVESGKIRSEILKNQLTLEIVNAYLMILYNQEQTEIVTKQLSTTEQQIERTEKLIQSGTMTKGDLLSLLSQKAEEESQLVGFKNQIKMSLLNLSQLMNYNQGEFEIEKPNLEEFTLYLCDSLTVQNIYSEALAFLPEVKMAESELSTTREDLNIAKSGYYPSLTLSMGFSSPYSSSAVNPTDPNPSNPTIDYPVGEQLKDRRQAEIGLSLSIPIFTKFRNRTNVANAKVGLLTAENEIEKTRQDIYKLIQSAHNDVMASRENFNARKQAVNASEESFRFAEQRFNAGTISAIDYNLEKNKLNQATSRLLQSKYDLLVKVKILDFYRGAEVQL